MKKSVITARIGHIESAQKPSRFGGNYTQARMSVYLVDAKTGKTMTDKAGKNMTASVLYNGKTAEALLAKYKVGEAVEFEGKMTEQAAQEGYENGFRNIVGNDGGYPMIKHSTIVKASIIGD